MVIPGFVLAGGASRRMGEDKALLHINGVPMARRVADVLAAAGCSPVTLVGRQAALLDLGLPVLRDTAPSHHPLWGVAQALESLDCPLALLAPCDLIHLNTEAVTTLLSSGAPCVAEGAQVHPLLAVMPRTLGPTARRLAEAGAPAHVLVKALPRIRLPEPVLHDANRPVDLPPSAE